MISVTTLSKTHISYIPTPCIANGSFNHWLHATGYYRRTLHAALCAACHRHYVEAEGLRCEDCLQKLERVRAWKNRKRPKCKQHGCSVRLTYDHRRAGYTGYCKKHAYAIREARRQARKHDSPHRTREN